MEERRDLIVRRLQDEGERTLSFFQNLDEGHWKRRIYSEGSRWTVRQILCHFVSAEAGFLSLAHDILADGEGAPKGMDIDAFNEREVGAMDDRSPAELLVDFSGLRRDMVALAKGIEEADLDRVGRHPFFGRSTLEKLLKLVYRHNMIHLRDVRWALHG
jgi:hypothetical protein